MSSDPTFPLRINKYLAHTGYATRVGADELVTNGQVTINGRCAVLGDKVRADDTVSVRGSTLPTALLYLAYNKPRGTVTHGAQKGEVEIRDRIRAQDPGLSVFPVGRLDKNSHGLILLTNDGRIVERLLSPHRSHEKEYLVNVNERLRSDFVEKMSSGVDIGDHVTKPCAVERIDKHTFRIVLTEGKNHQIKRMCDALGYTVSDLQRVRIMHVTLGELASNTYRALEADERATLLSDLGLPR